MGEKGYIRACWSELWNPDSRPWQYIDRILFPLLPLIAYVLYIIPKASTSEGWRDIMENLQWGIPIAIWFLFLLLVIPYRVANRYKTERNQARRGIADLQMQIETDNNTLPNVEYESVSALLFQGACYVGLVFRNNVVSPSGHVSTSQGTRAKIKIFKTNGGLVDFWDGRWAENDWPKSYGDIPEKNKRDIIAGDTARLDIGARIEGQVRFKGHYNRLPDSPEPPRKLLEPDSYYLRTELWAGNMRAKESWFTLQIPNVPQSNDPEQVKITQTTKPTFDKEGSQT